MIISLINNCYYQKNDNYDASDSFFESEINYFDFSSLFLFIKMK